MLVFLTGGTTTGSWAQTKSSAAAPESCGESFGLVVDVASKELDLWALGRSGNGSKSLSSSNTSRKGFLDWGLPPEEAKEKRSVAPGEDGVESRWRKGLLVPSSMDAEGRRSIDVLNER